MYKHFPRTILSIIFLTITVISISCININVPQTPTENKTTQGDQAAPPAAAELPNIESFTASPVSVLEGRSSTLSWSVKNATAIMITPGIGNVSATGSQIVTPASATTYTMVASNAAGMSSNSVVINIMMVRRVQPDIVAGLPNIESFTASPVSVLEGKSSTLSWSVKNATAIMITPGIGNVSAAGSQVVTPAAGTTYTMVASNAAGMSSKTVVVNIMILRKLQPIVETKYPDLTIGGIKAVGQQGSPWYIYYTVVNSGTESSAPCKVILLQDGAIMETILIDSISPGDGIDHKCMTKLTPAIELHSYEVRVDSDNTVVESNEKNNSRIVQLQFN